VDGAANNSFDHVGYAAVPGWPSSFLLDPSENPLAIPGSGIVPSLTPLENEIHVTHPSVALILIGTNDVTLNVSPAMFQANLLRIGQLALANGVIPVFSSLPQHLYGGLASVALGLQFDQIISNVAGALDVPFWNYWAALQNLPNAGISADLVHPSVYPGGAGIFTPQALAYGYNMRNLTAVEVLQEIKGTVIDGTGVVPTQPTQPAGVVTTADLRYIQNLYVSLLGRNPASTEVSGWAQVLQQGGSRLTVATGIWQSPEHYQREVTQDYETILQREPGPGETDIWVARLEAGVTEEQVQAQFFSSPEYLRNRPGAFAQVVGLYLDVLNRVPQSQEVTNWQNQISQGVSLSNVAFQILTSPEAYQDSLDVFYQTYLNRPATSQDHAAWTGPLQSGQLGLAQMGENILASDEYFALNNPS
jgi:hypothetical protein